MALTALQRDVCRLLAADRRAHGESYVAGGVALGVALETARISRDLDLFHDTLDAVARSWDRDRRTLAAAGYAVDARRERPGYVEATVSKSGQSLIAEWAQDSAFRFFPLVEHPELGLALAQACRSHYSRDELSALAFDGPPPDAQALNRRWHDVLEHAEAVVSRLPPAEAGRAVLTRNAELFTGVGDALERALAHGDLRFHPGRIGGAFPTMR